MNEQTGRKRVCVATVAAVAAAVVCVALALPGVRASAEQKAAVEGSSSRSRPTSASRPSSSSAASAACAACHTCANPTRQDTCLRPCGRAEAQAREFARKHGPDVVVLDELANRYLPVPFDHKGHARMAEMTGGCAVCHHYTPEGAAHPACKTCHEISAARADIRKPGLKGAYHRQCLNCHREWSHDTKCVACHLPKARDGDKANGYGTNGKDDILGRMHPPIPEPDTEIYQTRAKPAPGTRVIFRHKEHIHRFGLKCANCHREESCSRCHEKRRKHQQRVRTLADHHRPCSDCHDVAGKDKCGRCHWKQGEPRPKPFDHAVTGWDLGRHHRTLSCRACHREVPFGKLNRDCAKCHTAWAPGEFDHAVTGQVLDESHVEHDCQECHADGDFAVAPACDGCHEEDEGIAFPAKRPGPASRPAGG